MLKYMPFRKSKDKSSNENESTLKEADEEFLERIASEGAPPPLPTRPTIILDNGTKVKGKDAQVALMDGADKVPLPSSPPEVQEGGDDKKKEQRNYWSYMPTIPRTTADWAPYIPSVRTRHSDKDKETAGADLASAAESMKTGQQPEASEDEEKKERDDLSSVLDQLNMSATTTRTFSLSKESQKLMEDFTQILKDIVNGVPTAYDDLEKLLTTRNKEISHMFKNMPPWLQTLVKSLPAKLGSTMAPELMAAASEKPGADGKARLDPNIKVGTSEASVPTGKKKSKKSQIPTLKSLLATDGAVAGMLRSILNFLKLRFPMFVTGTNILMSVAVFCKCNDLTRKTLSLQR